MMRIFFIGLGNMGTPMVRRLAGAGYTVAVQDVDRSRVEALASESEQVGPADRVPAGWADVVITMLPTSAIVEEVLTEGFVASLQPGTLVIEMSSAEPDRSRAMAKRVTAAGLRYLDAPVSGGVRGAESGELAIMIGGDAADVEFAMPVLAALGRSHVHVGGHGAGHAAKALNNLVSAASVVATVEALRAAERFGVAPERFVEVLNASSGRSVTSEVKAPRFMLSGSFDSGFPIGLMSKDVTIAVELALAQGGPVELGAHVAEIWRRSAAAFAAEDHTRMYELLHEAERMAQEER